MNEPTRQKALGATALVLLATWIMAHASSVKAYDVYGFDVAPVAEVGYIAVEYNEDNSSEIGNNVKLGFKVEDTKFYLWATEEQTEPKLYGQSMGNLKSLSFGGGVGQEFGKWTIFMEAGKSKLDFKQNDIVVHEMVRTVMYKNHGYEGRYHPGRRSNGKTPHPVHKDVLNWQSDESYEIFDPIVAKLGVSFEPIPHVVVTAAYRISVADTEMNLWDYGQGIPTRDQVENFGNADYEKCSCWWVEEDTLSFSGWELSMGVKW